MIIPARKLPGYFHGIQFPVQILEETGDHVAQIVDRRGLAELIKVEAVIGVGTWKRIRHLRLNRPMESLVALRGKLHPLSIAASHTVVTTQLESGRQVRSFHGRRCVAYRRGRPKLDCSAL